MEELTLQHTKLDSIADYTAAIDTVIGLAQRNIRLFERNYEGIGFNSPKRIELLHNFVLASRRNRIFIVAHDTDYLAKYCPRLMTLLRQFSHAISINQTRPHAQGVHEAFVIADDVHYVHRFHFDHPRALLALNDPLGAHTFNDLFSDIWEASSPAISPTTTGL